MHNINAIMISAIILAGGKSSRMGKDKALLPMGDKTLLTHVCQVARDCSDRTYVVTPWSEYQDILPSGCQIVREPMSDTDSNTPLTGFALGMQLVKTEWVLLLACDLPYLASSQVKQWSFGLATVFPTEIALLPRGVKGWEPLCGFYRRSCIDSLQGYLDRGGKSFQSWLKEQPVRELQIGDRKCLFNCNTPADWQLVRADDELRPQENPKSL